MTNRQLVFVVFIACAGLTTVTTSQFLAVSADRGAWLTLLLTSLVFGLMAVVIVRLGRMYEGKMLFEYSQAITGRFFAYVLGIIYVLYFLLFEAALCNSSSSIARANFLPKSPQSALILILIPVCGFIAYKGLTNAARLAEIFCIWFWAVAALIYIPMLIEGDLNYLLPLFNASNVGKYIAATKEALPSFLGMEVLTVIPMTKNNKRAGKTAFFTLIGLGLFYILDVYGCYAMIGLNEIVYHQYPLIDAVRLVEYPAIEFLQRVDVSYMTFGFIRIFIGEGIIYIAMVELLCKMLPKAKRVVVVLVVGAVIAAVSMALLLVKDVSLILRQTLTYAAILTVFVIPLTLLIIAKVKKHGKKGA
jgi:spore germination protein (amino acid permease)